MIRAKLKGGDHIDYNESDLDSEDGIDAKEYHKVLKTKNSNLVKLYLSSNSKVYQYFISFILTRKSKN